MRSFLCSSLLIMTSLFSACGAEPESVDVKSVGFGERHQAACAAPAPEEVNRAVDLVIRSLGRNGTGCTVESNQVRCVSYSLEAPSRIKLGDNHASQSNLYLCAESSERLQDCSPPLVQEFDCDSNCTCGSFLDCLNMLAAEVCEPHSMKCDWNGCTCTWVGC